jgi:hypothetical protein
VDGEATAHARVAAVAAQLLTVSPRACVEQVRHDIRQGRDHGRFARGGQGCVDASALNRVHRPDEHDLDEDAEKLPAP